MEYLLTLLLAVALILLSSFLLIKIVRNSKIPAPPAARPTPPTDDSGLPFGTETDTGDGWSDREFEVKDESPR